MFFGETPKNLDAQEKIRLNKLADELDELHKAAAKRIDAPDGIIPYVDWIVQDLRRGDLKTAKINYEQQRDKYGNHLDEVRKFLEDNGIVDKGIDWNAWNNADSSEEYQKNAWRKSDSKEAEKNE